MSNYKLINKQTGEEHICQKVTIDGFDYYVSDTNSKRGRFYCYRTKNLFQDDGCDVNCCNSDINVLATNNPNIDVPKVVDVDIAFESYQKQPKEFKKGITQWVNGFHFGYNKSQETHPNSDEDMIEFAEWLGSLGRRLYNKRVLIDSENFDETKLPKSNVWLMYGARSKSTEELLQIWKQKRAKTIYYE